MASALLETRKLLEKEAASSDKVLVSYSGGKDSLVILDLCLRHFKHVECFFMYLVPGLQCIEEVLDVARKRWGVTIHQYPHWLVAKVIANGAYCMNHISLDSLPEWKLRDVYTLAVADTGIGRIATGAKKSDSLWRRRNMSTAKYAEVVYPIAEWSKLDVIGYLNTQGIPLPASSGRSATGIDLSTPSLLWLHDTFPDDFRRLCETFPFAESVVWRRKWYGVE